MNCVISDAGRNFQSSFLSNSVNYDRFECGDIHLICNFIIKNTLIIFVKNKNFNKIKYKYYSNTYLFLFIWYFSKNFPYNSKNLIHLVCALNKVELIHKFYLKCVM